MRKLNRLDCQFAKNEAFAVLFTLLYDFIIMHHQSESQFIRHFIRFTEFLSFYSFHLLIVDIIVIKTISSLLLSLHKQLSERQKRRIQVCNKVSSMWYIASIRLHICCARSRKRYETFPSLRNLFIGVTASKER